MIGPCDAVGSEGGEGVEKVFPHIPLLPRYFDRLRKGDPPAQDTEAEEVGYGPPAQPASTMALLLVAGKAPLPEPVPVRAPTPAPDSVALSDLAPHLPDPSRPFWWFSNTPLPHRKVSAGCPVEEPCGARLPPEADYWCHAGGTEWVKVDRSTTPKPEPKRRKKKPKPARDRH
jgi:hypothetical protein